MKVTNGRVLVLSFGPLASMVFVWAMPSKGRLRRDIRKKRCDKDKKGAWQRFRRVCDIASGGCVTAVQEVV